MYYPFTNCNRTYTLGNIGNKVISKLNNITKKDGVYNLFNYCQVTETGHTYVTKSRYSWNSDYDVVVSLTDIDDYCSSTGLDDASALKYLVSHEILHVLLDHFNAKYSNYNHKLFNIACDLEVNSYINMKYPALRAKDYGWPDMLSAEEYYRRLIKMYEEEKALMEEEAMYNPNFSSNNSSDDSSDDTYSNNNDTIELDNINDTDNSDELNSNGYSQSEDNIENEPLEEDENSKSNNTSNNNSDEEFLDEFIKNTFGDNQYNENVSEALDNNDDSLSNSIGNARVTRFGEAISKNIEKGFDKIEIKGLDKIIRSIEKKEKSQVIAPHSRKQTFTKLNNRRNCGNLILPGKKLEDEGVRKRFTNSAVAFFDISGSTHDIINTINVSAQRLHKSGVNIVFYDTHIIDEVPSDQPFRIQSAQGGTKVEECIKEYFEAHHIDKLERVYIFTDGADDFSNLKNIIDKFKVFYITTDKSVYEILTEKDSIPSDFYGARVYIQNKIYKSQSKKYA